MHHMRYIIVFRKSIAIVSLILHVSDFFGLFMISFNYGLILLGYF